MKTLEFLRRLIAKFAASNIESDNRAYALVPVRVKNDTYRRMR